MNDDKNTYLFNHNFNIENWKLVRLAGDLKKELEEAFSKVNKKDIELCALSNYVEKMQSTFTNEALRSSVVYGSETNPENGTLLELMKSFDLVIKNYHKIIDCKNQEINKLQDTIYQANKKPLTKKIHNLEVEYLLNKIARVEEDHRHTNSILRERNTKLEKLVDDLEKTLDKYSSEVKTLTKQLEAKSVQSSELTYQKENKHLKEIISKIEINNLSFESVYDDVKNVSKVLNDINIDIVNLKKQPFSSEADSKLRTLYLSKNSKLYLDINRLNTDFNNILYKLQGFLCKNSPKALDNDYQKRFGSSNTKEKPQTEVENESSKTISMENNQLLGTPSQSNQPQESTKASQLPPRPWISVEKPFNMTPVCHIGVMSYNILCDKLATHDMFGYCPSWALQWDYRKTLILSEITMYSADIICLQEVETHHFNNFFLPNLKLNGYEGIFAPKTRAKTSPYHKKMYVDGCAIFYKTEKFRCVKEYYLEFNQIFNSISVSSNNILNRVMSKDQIGLAVLLMTKETAWVNGVPHNINKLILVCTTHIISSPDFCDVKLVQVMMMIHALRGIINSLESKMQTTVELILCGDLNSLPDSGAIELLSSGKIAYDHPDFQGFPYKITLQRISDPSENPSEFCHSFRLLSAYSSEIMPYTNFTLHFKGVIDYIFYTNKLMKLLNVLGPVSSEWINENNVVGAPHPQIPSDHLPIVAVFEMMAEESNS